MFHDGGKTWKFRFAATRTGVWTFTSSSGNSALAGKSGTITVTSDDKACGFLTTKGNDYAMPVGNENNLVPYLFNVYMDEFNHRSNGDPYGDGLKDWLPDVEKKTRSYCGDAKKAGFSVIFIHPHVQFFKLGVYDSGKLPSGTDSPDPATFDIIERIIKTAYTEKCHVQMWAWGDNARNWTPKKLGGSNSTADKRLQRYIAACLGPIPGWSRGYGFDLFEWVSPSQVKEWGNYLKDHFGWQHLLEARDEQSFNPPDNMPIYAIDDRFSSGWYNKAVTTLNKTNNRPVLFNRRWIYSRDGYNMKECRRAVWQFTLSGGGVAGWFGPHWDNGATFSNPVYGYFRTVS